MAPGAPGRSDRESGTPSNRRRILTATAVAAWAVLLLVLAYVSINRDAPTVREQRSLADARPVVQRALGDVIAAAGPDVVIEVTEPTVEENCRITPLRSGAVLRQAVRFYATESDESALLDRIARQLPADYRARSRPGPDGSAHTLRADAGEFVLVKGVLTEPGLVTVTADTGCRPAPLAFPSPSGPAVLHEEPTIDDEPTRLLAALGVAATEARGRGSADCPGVGVYTVRATGHGQPERPLGQVLGPLAGPDATVVVDRPDRYAYRSGPLSVVVETIGDEVRAAVTGNC